MKQEALSLFTENYENKGMCSGLPAFLKKFDKEFKKTNTVKEITYYPWAVVERIFRMQGGKINVVKWIEQVAFEVFNTEINEDGTFEIKQKNEKAMFIHLQGEWMGETEDEFYPLFDNQNAKIIKVPDALDLNTARQRGMVRLIARLSGIGLHIFEQLDSQFPEEESTPEKIGAKSTIKVIEKEDEEITPTAPKKEPVKKPKTKKDSDAEAHKNALADIVSKEKTVEIISEEDNEEKPEEEQTGTGFFKNFIKGETISSEENLFTEKTEPPKEQEKTYGPETEEYAGLLLRVRLLIKEKGLQKQARAFADSVHREVLSEMTYKELLLLEQNLKG